MPLAIQQCNYSNNKLSLADILNEVTNEDTDEASDCEDVNTNALPAKNNKKSTLEIENGLRTPQSKFKRKNCMAQNGTEAESDEQSHSPPKQQKTRQSLFSPSSLMRGLSIDDEHEKSDKCTGISRSKYTSARRVLAGVETDDLPGREGEIQELRKFLFDHLQSGNSGSLYVSGQPGTGKTACLTHILRSEEVGSKFIKVYINCTGMSSLGAIYKKICKELHLKLDGWTEKDCLKAIDTFLSKKHKMVLMILDEVDQLVGRKQSILYTIFEWPSKPNSKLLLIAIANQLDLTDRTLTRLNAKCELKPKLMHFAPYSKDQLIDIFKSRLEAAGVMDVFSQGTIQLLAAKVASVSGDVRRALDIGRRVVELAEQGAPKGEIDLSELGIKDSRSKKNGTSKSGGGSVPVQLVASVLKNIYGASQTFESDIEDTFPLQQKILICCLLLILNNDKNKDITIGRLHDVFKRVCARRNLCAVDQAEFVGLCSLVETRGIVRVLSKKEPRLSKVVLQWDQDEITSALRDKQLIATILEDTSCLKR